MQSARQSLLPAKHTLLLSASVFAIVFIYILLPEQNKDVAQLLSNFVQLVPSLLGGLHILLSYRKRNEPLAIQRRGWTLIGLGAFCFGLGQVIWTYDESYLKIEVPFPSLADAGWMTSSLFLIIGTFLLFGQMRIAGRARILLDAAIAAGSFTVLIWYILVGQAWTVSHDPELSKLLGIIYPVFDVIILCAALLLFGSTKRDRNLRVRIAFLCAGVFGLMLADIAFNVLTLGDTFTTGAWPDAAWTCGWLFIWYACMPRPYAALEETPREKDLAESVSDQSVLNVTIPYIAVIASFVTVIALDFSQTQGKFSAAVYGIGWVLIVLVIVRQVFTLLENRHTLQENRILTAQLRNFNENLENIVGRRTTQLTALHRLARTVNDSLEIEAVLDAAVRHIPSAIAGEGLAICVFDKAESLTATTISHAYCSWRNEKSDLPEDVIALLTQPLPKGAEVVAFSGEPWFETAHGRSLCLRAPLCWRQHVMGVVGIVRLHNQFEPNDFELIESIGLSVGTAIENARQFAGALQAEQNLKGSLAEKEVLLKEIHHRVKNNMQVISSLLNMQASHTEDPQVRAMFQDSQNRIRSMALVHERLYRSADLAHINFSEYLNDITANLLRSYHAGRIRLETKIDDVALDIDTAVPCGLIVNELVSNALKHAFPSARERSEIDDAAVSVTLRTGTAGETELMVCDNGLGFPAELNFRETESLGLQLVMALAGQIGGTVDLARGSKDARGTKWLVVLPSEAVKAAETLAAEKRPANAASMSSDQGKLN